MLDSMAVQKILKEDTTTAIEVSEEDLSLYAEQLGIDVSKEKHLLWIAKKGLETPVPKPWCPVEDEKGRIYYYNHVTDKSSWEHPADEHFRKLVKQERDKHITSKEDTELGIESELSSLDDVPPITSGKNSMSAQMDESNLKSSNRRMGSLSKLHELGKEEKFGSASYLKSSVLEDEFGSRSFIKEAKSLGRRSNRNDPLIKVTDDNSLLLNHSTDEELSTGLDGIGFDRFAEQYGIMDASRLSPVMPSSQLGKDHSYMKMRSQPIPKNLLKTLFSTSKDLDQSFSEARKDGDLSFAEFLKEAEEYSNKSLMKDNSQAENSLEEKSSEDGHSKNLSYSSRADISIKGDSEQEMQDSPKHQTFADNEEKFKSNLHAMEDNWKRKLEGKEKELRLEHEKYIAELQQKLAEEKTVEEKKLNDSILLMKEENAVILAKQEQVLTEELEADLESAKEEIEMKKLATLQAIQEEEERCVKELDEKRSDVKQIFESKVQDLYLEMEKELEEKKKDIQRDHQQQLDDLTKEHAKHLEELKKNFQQTDDLELSDEVAALREELSSLKDQIETEKQALEKLQEEKDNLEEQKVQELSSLKEQIETEKQALELLQKEKHILEEQNGQELASLKDQVEAEKQALEKLQEEKRNLEEQKVQELSSLKEQIEIEKQVLEQLQEKKPILEEQEVQELSSLKQQIETEKQALEKLQEEKHILEEQKVQELSSLKEQIEIEKQVLEQLQEKKPILEEHKVQELSSLKEQVEAEKQTLKQLQEEKLNLEKQKVQLSELLQEDEMTKHNNEEERDRLLQEKNILQNQVIELKDEITEQNEALQCLLSNKSTLESEIMIIRKELSKQELLSQQKKLFPTTTFTDRFTDTFDLLAVDDDISDKEKSKSESEIDLNYKPEKEPEGVDDPKASSGVGENDKILCEEDKMERLEIKIDALEKAFRLLEVKLGNTVNPTLHSLPDNNKSFNKNHEKCECCSKTADAKFSPGLATNVQQLFSSEEMKNSPYLQKSTSNKYSVFCMPNNARDNQLYENNLVYNVYSKDLYQPDMNLALSPVYVSGNEAEMFPFVKSDAAIQLEQCKEKFRNLQAKHETSQLNLELIKKEIFNDISRKDADNSSGAQNFTYQQIPNSVCAIPKLESQYTESILPRSLTNLITFPTKTSQNDEWRSTIWQNPQRDAHNEQQFRENIYSSYTMVEEKENNPLDQFFTLTETVLDKELELFSKDKAEKHYMSYPTLNEKNASNNLPNSDSFDKISDSHAKDVTFSGLGTNYRPMYIHQPSFIGELITEKEDWMEKIGSMYQRIRAYERDLVLKHSLKTNV